MRKWGLLVGLLGIFLIANSAQAAISGKNYNTTDIECGYFNCGTPSDYWTARGAGSGGDANSPDLISGTGCMGGSCYRFYSGAGVLSSSILQSYADGSAGDDNYYVYYIGANTTIEYWVNFTANLTFGQSWSLGINTVLFDDGYTIDQLLPADQLNTTYTSRRLRNEVNFTVPYGYYRLGFSSNQNAYSYLENVTISGTSTEYELYDYVRLVNCTQHSSTAYGALVCSNSVEIPDDCINITTEAWTVISVQNETWLNDNMSFTRWTCNPEDDRVTYCDNLYETCEYSNFNSYPERRWDNYAAGQNATSFHIASIPELCLENQVGGNFSMIGRLYMACKSYTESGIIIDGSTENCTHELVCFNSDIMEERFADCTSILTPCEYGCVEGVCVTVTTTTLPSGTDADTLIDLDPYTTETWITMIFTPFSIISMMLVGVAAYFEQQVKSNGVIFLAVMIVGVLGFTYLGLYPAWVGVLIIILCGALLSKAVQKVS